MNSFKLPQLNYDYDKLAPSLSNETLTFHHDKHHNAYVTNLNKLIEGTEFAGKDLEYIVKHSTGAIFNNAAQTWNHTFYFEQFGKKTDIKGKLADEIIKQWGSIENFQNEFNTKAAAIFGSGWCWLVIDNNHKLSIIATSNAGNPLTEDLTPLFTVDVWEHAYYIDYRNQRGEYLKAIWNILDWEIIEKRYCK